MAIIRTPSIIIEEEFTDDIYVDFDQTPVGSEIEDLMAPLRDSLQKVDAGAENASVVSNLGLTYTEFDLLIQRVLTDQKNAANYLPNVIFHLANLIHVLEMHRTTLAGLGFRIFDFVQKVTDLFVRMKQRISRGITIFDLMISWLESTSLHSNKEEKHTFFDLVKKKVQQEWKTIEEMRANVQKTREIYNKEELLKKIAEAEEAAKTMPKISKMLKMIGACLGSGVGVGGGAAAIATYTPIFGGVGVIAGAPFPPLIIGIILSSVLGSVSAVTGAIIYASKLSKQQEQILDRLRYFETMFVVCHELLNVMEGDMDDIITTLQSGLDLDILEAWIDRTTNTAAENKPMENMKRSLDAVSSLYSDVYKTLSEYDKFVVASNGYLEGPHQSSLVASIKPAEAERKNPKWQDDKDAPVCNKCHASFNWIRRRHHCRVCLYIFCDACSSHYVELPTAPNMVRACERCALSCLESVAKTPKQLLDEIKANMDNEDFF